MARKVIKLLNNAGKIMQGAHVMDNRFMASPEQLVIHESVVYDLPAAAEADANNQKPLAEDGWDVRPRLTEGYTTRDDIGTDGDDTVHAPVNFYVTPNCIRPRPVSRRTGVPEAVDLVFWISLRRGC